MGQQIVYCCKKIAYACMYRVYTHVPLGVFLLNFKRTYTSFCIYWYLYIILRRKRKTNTNAML